MNILKNVKSFIAVTLNLPSLYSNNSFSQDGEDLILEKIFKKKTDGFYVDVGAHHPFRYSNTQALYLKGWSGINIEPTPNNIHLFDKTRKRDTNIQTAVGKNKGKITLYCFEDSALNTTSKRAAEKTIKSKQSKLLSKVKVKVDTLEHILDNKVRGKQIDFLNVDI